MKEPFDEIRVRRLATGYLSEYWRNGACQYKMFDITLPDGLSPGGQKMVSTMMAKMLISEPAE